MREIAPFGLRLAPALKERLEEIAGREGRSLQKEIVMRLEASLHPHEEGHQVRQPIATYTPNNNDAETAMLRLFRHWPPEKQLAFLTLFRE